MNDYPQQTRPVLEWGVLLCLAVAAAPWLSGGQESSAYFVSAGAMVLGLVLVWMQPTIRAWRNGPLTWAYGAWIGWGVLSLAWSINHYSTLKWLFVMIMAGLVFRLAYSVAGWNEGRRRLAQMYLVSVAGALAYGVWVYLTVPYDRFVGPFYWPNAMAIYLVPALLLAVHGVRAQARRPWLWWGVLVAAGAGFSLTDSRGSMLVLVFVLVIYFLIQRFGRSGWLRFGLGVVSVVLLSIFFVQLHSRLVGSETLLGRTTPGARYGELATGSQSGSDRWYYLKSAVAMWWDRPVLGVGAGSYGDAHPHYQQRVVSAGVNAHNFYVQSLAELGIIGVIILAWLLVALSGGVIRGVWKEGGSMVVLGLGLVAGLLHLGLDMDSQYPALVFLLAGLAGALYSQRERPARRVSWRLLMVGGGLLVMAVSIYRSAAWADRGRALQGEGDYEAAVEAYDAAHQSWIYNPDVLSAEALNLYGRAQAGEKERRNERLALALELARQAEREDPLDAQHYQAEAWVLSLQGDLAGAARVLETALTLDPYNYPGYALDLAKVKVAQGKGGEALAVAQRMLAQYTPEVISNRSIEPTLKPSLARLWVLAGWLREQQQDRFGAARALLRAQQLDPHNKDVQELTKSLQAPPDTIAP